MGVVFSQMTDAEAAHAIRDLVAADPRGAQATLRYVARARGSSNEYITDRHAVRSACPDSQSQDPLLRSAFARQLVAKYAAAVLAGPHAGTTERPMWDRGGPHAHVVFTSHQLASPTATGS